MKKILQITIEVNRNSVGKIAEQIGEVVLQIIGKVILHILDPVDIVNQN